MAIEVKELDGRKWSDNESGGTVKRRFRITGLQIGFTPAWDYLGLPKIGDCHPVFTDYVCSSRDFEEGLGRDKTSVVVTVQYTPVTAETTGGQEEEEKTTCRVDEWGWSDGTDEIELTAGADGTPVVNTAGDAFDSVPKVMTPAPVFTKSMKFAARQAGWSDSNCKVNADAVTIGDISYPAGSLLCTICESRIFGDANWKYRYVVHLRYKSHKVKLAMNDTVTDVGWDVAIVDAGMRELDENNQLKVISYISRETGNPCTVTSTTLLDGQGHRAKIEDGETAYTLRFQAYPRTTFPAWFYSEPGLDPEPKEENQNK